MRTLIKLSALCLAIGSVALFAGNIANAADQNSYRAGTPYLKTIANHFGQCEQQCRGDAACRSWNFVRPNAGSASGICEFNSRMANPVSSPVSMSGAMRTNVDPLMSHAVAASHNDNTIRVGTPTIVRPAQLQNRQTRNRQHPTTSKQQTIVKRQPIPQQRAPQQTKHTRPAPKASNLTPRVYGSVQQKAQAPAEQTVVKQTVPQQLTPQQAYYRQQYLAQKQYQVDMRKQQQIWQQQNAQRAPQNMLQQGQALQKQTPQMQAPRSTQQAQRPMPQQGVQIPAHAPMQNHVTQQRPQSLYGSLHDDLTQNMTIVPRPQTAPDHMNNPDAPISTSRAVPTTSVQTAPMSNMAMPGLAGG